MKTFNVSIKILDKDNKIITLQRPQFAKDVNEAKIKAISQVKGEFDIPFNKMLDYKNPYNIQASEFNNCIKNHLW